MQSQAIAEVLRQVVDQDTDGKLPPEQDLNQAFERLAEATPEGSRPPPES